MKRAAIEGDCVILVFTMASAEGISICHCSSFIFHLSLPELRKARNDK